MQRRTFLGLTSLLLAGGSVAGWTLMHRSGPSPLLLSARDDSQGRHYAVGYHLDGRQAFSCPVNERCHDVVPHPYLPLAFFTGRRPSRESYLIDTRDGRLLQVLQSHPERHFQGHAVFHASGEWLYTTENDTREPGRGVIGRYQLKQQQLERQAELSSHGVGPHQLLWMPDGETLVVANGGIRTEAESRVEMNLDAMDASLVLIDRNGALLSHERLPEPQNSIRHLAVAADGTVVSAQQFMGDPQQSAPLLAIKRPGQTLQTFPVAPEILQSLQQYTASVAINSPLRLLGLTAPRGNRLLIWDLDTANLRLNAPLADCAGIAATSDGFVVSSGLGRCRAIDCSKPEFRISALSLPAGHWDNHLRLA